VYTAEDIKSIASLYFERAELSAVLAVIEKVENDTLKTMSTDSAMRIDIEASKHFEGVQDPLEADCDTASARGKSRFERAWRGWH